MIRRSVPTALFVVASLAAAGLAFAHSGASGVVRQRMNAMSDIARQMKTIGLMIMAKQRFHGETAAEAAERIAFHGRRIEELFPKGTHKRPSEALPAIWADWDGFLALSAGLEAKAARLAGAARKADAATELAAPFKALGGTCRSCHERFRQKK